jgi:hypothetical protein
VAGDPQGLLAAGSLGWPEVERRVEQKAKAGREEGQMSPGADPPASDLGPALAHRVMKAAGAAAEGAPSAVAPSQPRRVRVAGGCEGTAVIVSAAARVAASPPALRARVLGPGFVAEGERRGA